MTCQICSAHEAVVHFKQVTDGDVKEMHVCAECAAEHGLNVQSPMSMTDFLFGMGAAAEPEPGRPDVTCPACRMKLGEFRKRSRMGCPVCYDTFSEELSSFLSTMHRGTQHVGKVPERDRASGEAAALKRALAEAVGKQAFEEAARLRDRIRALKPDGRHEDERETAHDR